jgi:hypothetical protein
MVGGAYMEINRDQVLSVVIEALKEAQLEIGEDTIEITEKTCPIGELKQFDSLTSVGVTIRCFDSLKCDDPLEIPSIFIEKGKALTVGEVVDRILNVLKNK